MKKKKSKSLIVIAVMLVLCILAGSSIVRTVKQRAEEAREAELAEQAAQAEAEAAAQEEQENQASERAAGSEKVYAYRSSSDDGIYTMAAYDNAVEAGAAAIVLPFVVSQDGTLYVADDDYAQELTGYGGYFSGMGDGQIDNLETRSGTKVLKLSEVFDKFGKDVHYILELKYVSERNQEALRKIIEQHGNEDVVSVSCRYFKGLRTLEGSLPDVPKIFVCQDEGEFGEAKNLEFVDTISVSRDLMSEELCRDAHDHGKKFGAWNLNTEEDIKKALEMGADSFFTDEAVMAAGIESSAQE